MTASHPLPRISKLLCESLSLQRSIKILSTGSCSDCPMLEFKRSFLLWQRREAISGLVLARSITPSPPAPSQAVPELAARTPSLLPWPRPWSCSLGQLLPTCDVLQTSPENTKEGALVTRKDRSFRPLLKPGSGQG